MDKRTFLIVLVISSLFTTIGIFAQDDPTVLEFDFETFSRMKESWISQAIGNYSFRYQRSGDNAIDCEVTITDGNISSVVNLIGDDPHLPVYTIDELFERLESQYLEEIDASNPDADIRLAKIEAEYDSQYGLITKLIYHYDIKPGVPIVIEPDEITITNFQINS